MLITLLREELVTVESLRQLLQREYEILKSRDLPGLEQIISEKQVCADHIRSLTAKRLDYLQAQGFSADMQGLTACMNASQPGERTVLNTLWAELADAAEQVRAQNQINGTVIAASRNHIEQIRGILSGRNPLDFLYNQETHKIFGNDNSRPIAKA